MLCPACNKESKNLRVCPYCFTPYPVEGASAKRPTVRQTVQSSAAAPAASVTSQLRDAYERARTFVMRQTPLVRWTGAGILVMLLVWWTTSEPTGVTAGVPTDNVISTPLERDEALALIRQTRENALVDVQQDEVFVSYPAATFPVREEGQLALAQQFAQADAIVEGRRRRIFFYNPNGKLFAQADGARGVIFVR